MNPFKASRDILFPSSDKPSQPVASSPSPPSKKIIKQNEEQLDSIKRLIQPLHIHINGQIMEHNEKVKYPNGIPTMLETETCAKKLQSEFPTLRIDLIVSALHSTFDKNCEARPAGYFHQLTPSQQICSYDMPYNLTKADYTQENIKIRNKQKIDDYDEQKVSQEQHIAITYLNYGYGVRILRQYINDPQINATRYNNMVTYIMKIAFRRLEQFMKELGRIVVPINTEEQKLLRAPLVNCEKWLPPDELEVFYRFIKLACRLENQMPIDQKAAIKLYSSCIRQLHQRRERQRQGDRRRCNKRKQQIEETRDKSLRSEDNWEPKGKPEKNGLGGSRYCYMLPYHN